MKKQILLVISLFSLSFVFAQKVTDENLNYKYKRFPLHPIDKQYKTYEAIVDLVYEEEDRLKMEEYQKNSQAAADNYQKEKQEAEAKYQKEKQEYKETSFGKKFLDKVILEQDNRPKKEAVGKENVQKPYTHKAFDKQVLASSYIKLEGYEKATSSDLKVIFTIHGIEWTEMKINESTTSVGMPSGQTKKVYSASYKYRSPITVKVQTADGNIVWSEIVSATNEYKNYTGPSVESSYLASQKSTPEVVMQSYEQRLVDDNMKLANQLLNEKCAITNVQRKIELYNVESKKADYSDYQNAYLSAMEGYLLLVDNYTEASNKLKVAITNWEKALQEYNPNDKKARINEEVSIATIFNLAESYIVTNDFMKAKLMIAKAKTLDLSKKENKRFEEIKSFAEDQQARADANLGKD